MKKPSIVQFKNAHFWKKDNEYILTGYRKNHNSIKKILKSLKTKHNELMNIWTHLFPTILLIIYTIFFAINKFFFCEEGIPMSFNLPLLLAYIFSIICLGSSSVYHLFSCISCKTCCNLIKYDFFSIVAAIYFYSFSIYFYIFYRSNLIFMVYFGMQSLVIFFLLFIIVSPKYQSHEFRNLRTFSFISFAIINMFPIFHTFFNSYFATDDNDFINYDEAYYYLVLELFFFSIGVVFFLTKYPEKAFPKKFDIWMNSHALWHIFVVLGMFMQLKVSNVFYNNTKFSIFGI